MVFVIIGYSKEHLKIHTGSLPSPSPSLPLHAPLLSLRSRFPLFQLGVWESAASSFSGVWGRARVWGRAPAEIDFSA